jgi:hypothetical protein
MAGPATRGNPSRASVAPPPDEPDPAPQASDSPLSECPTDVELEAPPAKPRRRPAHLLLEEFWALPKTLPDAPVVALRSNG